MVVFDFLQSIKSLVKVEQVHTDNNIFKLHYKATILFLLSFSILLTSKQFFGDPIDCTTDAKEISLVNSFCWTHGTYINLDTIQMQYGIESGLGVLKTSISPHDQRYPATRYHNNGFIVQKYYQWVCLFLCFQALFFYIPRYLWKFWEEGRMQLLVRDLAGPMITSDWNDATRKKIVDYIVCRKYSHNCYALRFAFCEVLNLVNVIMQIYITNLFLSGYFIDYGLRLLDAANVNPMTLIFPKLAKCKYVKYGPSGSDVNRDALCLLPLNVVNEKIFAFLWFWYAGLTVLTFCQLLYRLSAIMSRTFREKLLRARCQYLGQKTTDLIIDNFTYGEMFILELFAKNMNPIIFKELIVDMANVINERSGGFHADITIAV